jgi:uncharacterized membrane protein
MNTRFLVRAAVYAALYIVLTVAPGLNAIAYGQVQFRVSECLLVFVLFDAAALPGLVVGTAVANGFGPMPTVDVWFGSLLTLVSCVGMRLIAGPQPMRRPGAAATAGETAADAGRLARAVIALLVPVVVNGFGVAFELAWMLDLPFWPSVAWVSLGEAVVVYLFGLPLLLAIRSGALAPAFGRLGNERVATGSDGRQGGTT